MFRDAYGNIDYAVVVLASLLVVILLCVVLLPSVNVGDNTVPAGTGVVVARHYTPSKTGTGFGRSFGGGGGWNYSVVRVGEEYALEVRDDAGVVHMIEVSKEFFLATRVSDQVSLYRRTGFMSNELRINERAGTL